MPISFVSDCFLSRLVGSPTRQYGNAWIYSQALICRSDGFIYRETRCQSDQSIEYTCAQSTILLYIYVWKREVPGDRIGYPGLGDQTRGSEVIRPWSFWRTKYPLWLARLAIYTLFSPFSWCSANILRSMWFCNVIAGLTHHLTADLTRNIRWSLYMPE